MRIIKSSIKFKLIPYYTTHIHIKNSEWKYYNIIWLWWMFITNESAAKTFIDWCAEIRKNN